MEHGKETGVVRHRSLLDRLGASELTILAAPSARVPKEFTNVRRDAWLHGKILDRILKFRGEIYLQEGAIQKGDLDAEGRFRLPADDHSWHLISEGEGRSLIACVRVTWFQQPAVRFADLALKTLVGRMEPALAARYQAAIERFLEQIPASGLQFGEIGGWAVRDDSQGSAKGLLLACACWSLGEFVGGSLAIAAATKRNRSVEILRRLGGFAMSENGIELPAFFDPYHRCEMEILGFDSRRPHRQHSATIKSVHEFFPKATVVTV